MSRKNDGFFCSILEKAKAKGWRVERTTKGHWQLIPPDTSKPMVVTGNTSGDKRSVNHFLSQMRRSGYVD